MNEETQNQEEKINKDKPETKKQWTKPGFSITPIEQTQSGMFSGGENGFTKGAS